MLALLGGAVLLPWRVSLFKKALALATVLLSAAAGFAVKARPEVAFTCYVPCPGYNVRRDAATLARQRALLEKFRDGNVISTATFEKSRVFLEQTPASGPASQPAK